LSPDRFAKEKGAGSLLTQCLGGAAGAFTFP
jgi:hypothetical protein